MTIFKAKIVNGYRVKRSVYHPTRGHSGIDTNHRYENLPSPVTGKVLEILHQTQMGLTLYIEDAWSAVHVFSHLEKVYPKVGDWVGRQDIIALTGNTGSVSTGPHLHFEIVCRTPFRPKDKIMIREGLPYKGYNTEPISYLKALYDHYGIDWKTGNPKELVEPNWIGKLVKKIDIPYPDWLRK
jgi:murein DD-endopeptidase MepM/ murein hydrolase activator NlpD